eukprot:CAMPEP_0118689560 /NCGR_PEP_ID=MMETSP0800-20121206/9564_1 /TAXON_ID=210618 ORGANISM="Striatella unipunctata, Strain CCMP2910" /NCGR_SAMPLE_ID=MMETSP0800 /ASSEMBLY_ACC=CAM_ASM_000638 /LENGTH=201 /DNA_ID=CAMNT_0006586985 /DNA_START=86 /DNA_END=691 /DNA_ORIENTATION=-
MVSLMSSASSRLQILTDSMKEEEHPTEPQPARRGTASSFAEDHLWLSDNEEEGGKTQEDDANTRSNHPNALHRSLTSLGSRTYSVLNMASELVNNLDEEVSPASSSSMRSSRGASFTFGSSNHSQSSSARKAFEKRPSAVDRKTPLEDGSRRPSRDFSRKYSSRLNLSTITNELTLMDLEDDPSETQSVATSRTSRSSRAA